MSDWIDVSDTTPRISYTASADQTDFLVPFVFFDNADLQVYQNGTLLGLDEDYTVTGAEEPNGGSITLVLPADVSDEIMIVRDIPIEQTTHIPPSGPLDIAAINLQFSRLIAIIQQLANAVARTIRLSDSTSGEIEIAEPVADQYLKWNATADGIESTAIITPDGTYALATQSEAEVGTDNTTLMTPLRTAQAIDARVRQPTACYLSLSSTAATSASDITGSSATNVYLIDEGGGGFPTYSVATGRWTWQALDGTALSIALDSNAVHTNYHAPSSNFDVYGAFDPVLGAIIGTTGAVGTSMGNRGSTVTDITTVDGVKVSVAAQTLRYGSGANDFILIAANEATYLGSIGTVAAGQGEDSILRRLVFNAYSGRDRRTLKKYTGSAYDYNTAAYRQVAGSASYQTEILLGLTGIMVEGKARQWAVCSSAPTAFQTAIGIGSGTTTPISETLSFPQVGRATDATGGFMAAFDFRSETLGVGRKVFVWLEVGAVITHCQFQTNNFFFGNGIEVVARGI